MIHTKFRENRPTDSGEEEFRRDFTIYGRGGHLGHETSIISTNFHFHFPKSLHTNLVKNSPVIYEESMFKIYT